MWIKNAFRFDKNIIWIKWMGRYSTFKRSISLNSQASNTKIILQPILLHWLCDSNLNGADENEQNVIENRFSSLSFNVLCLFFAASSSFLPYLSSIFLSSTSCNKCSIQLSELQELLNKMLKMKIFLLLNLFVYV